MMVVGLLMVLANILIIVLTDEEPLAPTALGVIGVAFVAVGARQRRNG